MISENVCLDDFVRGHCIRCPFCWHLLVNVNNFVVPFKKRRLLHAGSMPHLAFWGGATSIAPCAGVEHQSPFALTKGEQSKRQ